MNDITKCKLIFLSLVQEELKKKRDHYGKGEPLFGEKSNAAAACLLYLSDEYEKLLSRLCKGETMESIIPGFEYYEHENEELDLIKKNE